MKSKNIWYVVGYLSGSILIYGLYALAIFGFVTQILNKEIPYIPIILFATVLIATKCLQIYFLVVEIYYRVISNDLKNSYNKDLDNMIKKVIGYGGPN
jgi:hypothetical protein